MFHNDTISLKRTFAQLIIKMNKVYLRILLCQCSNKSAWVVMSFEPH